MENKLNPCLKLKFCLINKDYENHNYGNYNYLPNINNNYNQISNAPNYDKNKYNF